MRKKIIFLSVVLSFIFIIPAYSAERMRIVVMSLKADGVSDRTARTVTNMLRTEFINIGRFTVVERAQMDAIFQEQGLQQTGCTDQACAVQIGKLMSARKIMVGEVSPMGRSIIMTVRIVDVEKGISEFAASQKAESEDVLDVAVTNIARNIANRIEGGEPVYKAAPKEKAPAPKETGGKTRLGYYMRAFVPGWGQIYAGRKIKGWIFVGTFTASAVLSVIAINNYNKAKSEYDDFNDSNDEEEFDNKFDEYEQAGKTAKIFAITTAGIYLLNWLDILILSRPDFGSNVSTLNNERNFYTFNAVFLPNGNTNYKQVNFGFGTRF